MMFPFKSIRNTKANRVLKDRLSNEQGVTLLEILISLIILSVGLLAAAQLLFMALAQNSLSRSKDAASVVAQNKLDSLADLFRQNKGAVELTSGNHGPEIVSISDPADGTVLNRFSISWTVDAVSDPRPGITLDAVRVVVTVTPIQTSGNAGNIKSRLNKVVSIGSIFSPRESG